MLLLLQMRSRPLPLLAIAAWAGLWAGCAVAAEPLSLVSVLRHDRAFDRPHDIELQGDLAFVAGKGGSVAIVDVSQPQAPRLVWHEHDVQRLSDAETVLPAGDTLFLGTDAFHSIDISNPHSPTFSSTLSDGTRILRINGMVRCGDTVFAACKHGWIDAFDVRNPAEPSLATALDVRERFDVGWPHDIDGYQGLIVVTDPRRFGRQQESGKLAIFRVFDESGQLLNSQDWERIGGIATPELVGANRVQVKDDIAYVGASTVGQGGRLLVVDLSDPRAPRQIASVPFASQDGWGPNGLTVAGNVAFLAGGQTLEAIDVSNPHVPRKLASWTSPQLFPTGRDNGHDLVFRTNLLYVTAQNDNQIGIVRIDDASIRRLANES